MAVITQKAHQKLKNKLGKEYIDKSKSLWQTYYDRELTDDDVVNIFNNTTRFFSILIQEKMRQKQTEGGDEYDMQL